VPASIRDLRWAEDRCAAPNDDRREPLTTPHCNAIISANEDRDPYSAWCLDLRTDGRVSRTGSRFGNQARLHRRHTAQRRGQAFPDVSVDVSSPVLAKQARPPDHSTVDGFYEITELPPGTYSLKFRFMRRYDVMSGLGRTDCATRDKVVVRAGIRATVNAVLKYCGDYTYEVIRSAASSAAKTEP